MARMPTCKLPSFVRSFPFHDQYLTFPYYSSSVSEKDEEVVATPEPVAAPAEDVKDHNEDGYV
jgi:hypothetical protein